MSTTIPTDSVPNMIIKKLKSIICRWAHDDENKRLREKLRMYKGYLRAANKGAECNARVAQLSAARNSQLLDRIRELQKRPEMFKPEKLARELEREIATLETRHAAVMLHTQAVIDANAKLRECGKALRDALAFECHKLGDVPREIDEWDALGSALPNA